MAINCSHWLFNHNGVWLARPCLALDWRCTSGFECFSQFRFDLVHRKVRITSTLWPSTQFNWFLSPKTFCDGNPSNGNSEGHKPSRRPLGSLVVWAYTGKGGNLILVDLDSWTYEIATLVRKSMGKKSFVVHPVVQAKKHGYRGYNNNNEINVTTTMIGTGVTFAPWGHWLGGARGRLPFDWISHSAF